MKSGTICVVVFLLSGITVIAQNQAVDAKRFFETARDAFDAERWRAAATQFEQSYRIFPDSLTAYFVCLSYAHLDRPAETRDYAHKALSGSPRLRDGLRGSAEWLLDRINQNRSPIWSVTTGTTFDTFTPQVPQERTLDLPTEVGESPEPNVVYELRSRNSDLCLDVWTESREDGGRLAQFMCHGGANQQFQLRVVDNDQYLLVAQHSGKCIDVAGESIVNGASVVQYQCHGRPNQRFQFISAGDGFEVVAVHSNKCLDVWEESHDPGADIRQYQCHGRANQLWVLRRVR